MAVLISKPAINLREELASLRNQGGLPKEDKLYLDNLVDNGDFSNGTTGWTPHDSNLSVVNGTLKVEDTVGTFGYARYEFSTTVGKAYILKGTLVDATTGNTNANYVQIGVPASGTSIRNTNIGNNNNTDFSFLFVATGTTTRIGLASGNGVGEFAFWDNVSVQEVGENLVTNGTFDSGTTGWSVLYGSISVSSGVLTLTEDGSDSVTARVYQSIPVQQGKTYVVKASVSNATAGTGVLTVAESIHALAGNPSASTANGDLVVYYTATSNSLVVAFSTSGATARTVELDNVEVYEGSHPVIQSIPHGYDVKDVYIDGELAREGEAYDYQVQTDGMKQWLKPTVEPTATTETVVIGVRK